jgi:glycogen debranching enzyme
VWPWLIGAFVDAWLRVRGNSDEARVVASHRFVAPLEAHLEAAGLGHVSEIADADPPFTPRGCPFQAWSVGELIRARALVAARTEVRQTTGVRSGGTEVPAYEERTDTCEERT